MEASNRSFYFQNMLKSAKSLIYILDKMYHLMLFSKYWLSICTGEDLHLYDTSEILFLKMKKNSTRNTSH